MSRYGLLALLLVSPATMFAAEMEAPGRVTAVTVFQGQALVTREVRLPEQAGLLEVVITGLPEMLVRESLYAEGGEGVEVRSVRTRVRPAGESSREDVQSLKQRLEELQQAQREVSARTGLLKQRTEYLNKLEKFSAETATTDLKRGALDADALAGLTEMIFKQRVEITEAQLRTQVEARQLEKQQQLVARELQTLTAGSEESKREAVVFLSKGDGPKAVRLMYLVNGATWSPSYNLRASESDDTLTLEYNASVTQMSGEDWSEVAMTLSTATPSLVASAPKLAPLTIRLSSPKPKSSPRRSKAELSQLQRQLVQSRNAVQSSSFANGAEDKDAISRFGFNHPTLHAEVGGSGGVSDADFGTGGFGGGGFGAAYTDDAAPLARTDNLLNRFACEAQLVDIATRGRANKEKPDAEVETEGMSVVYRLEETTSLPSRSDKQLIQIAAIEMDAERYRVASPVLTEYVYREARVTNDSDRVLLAGPAATFLGDRFVGRSEVPTVAAGESFTVGLGIDESLRASRELVDKTDRVQGGNRIVGLAYRLAIESFGEEVGEVRVFDRLPHTEDEAIKVTLAESSPEPIEDHEGDQKGLLRWDVTGDDQELVEISYTVQIEHDKNLTLTGGVE